MKATMHIDGYYVTYNYTSADPGAREHPPLGREIEVTEILDRNGLACDASMYGDMADKVHARILEDRWGRF